MKFRTIFCLAFLLMAAANGYLYFQSIAPVVGSSIYSNWLNHQQQTEITRLVETAEDANSPLAVSLKGRITKQATIVAMKNITGTTVMLILGTAGICLLLPYHKGETT